MLLIELIFEKVQVSERKDLEKLVESLTADLVVIDINIVEILLVLQNINQGLSTVIVDFVIGQLELLQRMTLGDEVTDDLATLGSDLVVRQAEDV